MSERLTIYGAAKAIGVADSTVRKWVARKKLAQGEDGLVELADAQALKAEGNGRRGARKASSSQYESLAQADLAKAEIDIELKRLKATKLAGELIDRAEAGRVVGRWAQEIRDRLTAWCSREAPLAASACGGDAAALRRYLDQSMREELIALADGDIDFGSSGAGDEEDEEDDLGRDPSAPPAAAADHSEPVGGP